VEGSLPIGEAYNRNKLMGAKHSKISAAATDEGRWRSVLQRDSSNDDAFVFGVLTTGVYCRPSCPARRPLRKNVRFYKSSEAAEREGLRPCLRCRPSDATAGKTKLIERLCRYIESHAEEKITLSRLSKVGGISRFHLQRVFMAELGVSPLQYLQSWRFSQFKQALRENSVTDAWVEAGYSSSSRLYETAGKRLGMSPRRYGQGGKEETLRFTTFDTSLGKMLLAASSSGVCCVQFIDYAGAETFLRLEYPKANLVRDEAGLEQYAGEVTRLVDGEKISPALPLDIRGTAFQQKVWRLLLTIPTGQTRSYSEIAAKAGSPLAVRAVAGACAANRLAVVVPCHRVIHANGSEKGYRWGNERKTKLLEVERSDSIAAGSAKSRSRKH